jgi:hypothetical protein
MRDASYGHHRSPGRHLDMVCGLWCWFTIGMQNSNSGKATSLISEAVPLRARLVAGVINLSHNSARIHMGWEPQTKVHPRYTQQEH